MFACMYACYIFFLTAMYHIGIGPTQLNNFLSINFPAVSNKTIQRRCKEVGITLEEMAKHSIDNALINEIELSTAGTDSDFFTFRLNF